MPAARRGDGPLAFHGGTALRFLYAIPRYSEDMDFALEQAREEYDLRAYLTAIRAQLEAEGYAVELRVSDRRVVHSAFVRLPGLLYELGLSPHRTEVLAVKVEVDTHPPAGAVLATTVVRRYVTLQIQTTIGLPSWPASCTPSCSAPISRAGTSMICCGTSAIRPGLRQTWRSVLRERLQALDWEQVAADVRPSCRPGPIQTY